MQRPRANRLARQGAARYARASRRRIAGPGRRQDHLRIGGDVLAQALERRRDPRALVGGFHFVALGQHDRVGDGGGVERAHRFMIVLFEAVPAIDEHEYAQQRRTAAQIVTGEFAQDSDFAFATAA